METRQEVIELTLESGIPLGRHFRLFDSLGERAVFCDGVVIARYDVADKAAEASTIVLLARAGVASQSQLAIAFNVHRNTVVRALGRYQAGGMAAVVPAKRGPRGPHKVTAEVERLLQENAGKTLRELRALVREKTGVLLSVSHLQRLRQRTQEPKEQTGLALPPVVESEALASGEAAAPSLEPEVATPEAVPLAAEEPAAAVPEQARGRYMGAALYYPALEGLGLLEVAASCFRLPKSNLFGVRAVTLTLFFLGLFSKTTLEAAKHLRRWEFGPLVGAGRAPSVKTLRRKLAELVKQGQASHFGELLARRWVEGGLLATAYLYVDGHMKAYTGKRKLAEVWNAQRRMPLPGVLSYFVNDQQGRPLLFVTEEANASLAQAMPKVVAAIREVVGGRPFTVIFDRGGYDGKLFAWLKEEGIDFITYERGEPALPEEQFHRRECRFEGRRVRMQLAEDEVDVGRSGPLRRIVVRTRDGHQTPILTSLKTVSPARVACLMFARWRQENFFKYSREHHGLDQLLGYAWAEADGARLVPNPERRRVERELKVKRQELSELRSELGQVLLDEPIYSGRSAHGLKIAQKGEVGRVRKLEKEIEALVEQRGSLPHHVPLAEAGPRAVLRLEQKAIVDRVKISAYNAEEWLLDLLFRHYSNPYDVRALLRSFAELSGELRTTATGVVVTLDSPDIPLQRSALRGLCTDLNKLVACFPGTDLPVRYEVAVHHSEGPI